jgi:hypothetical protein
MAHVKSILSIAAETAWALGTSMLRSRQGSPRNCHNYQLVLTADYERCCNRVGSTRARAPTVRFWARAAGRTALIAAGQ